MESLRNQGPIPAVKSFTVGRDYGGEHEVASTYVIEDLDGYWQYLIHPSHRHTDRIGLPLVDKAVSFDITDDPDPEMGAKIAALHQSRYDQEPELIQLGLGQLIVCPFSGAVGRRLPLVLDTRASPIRCRATGPERVRVHPRRHRLRRADPGHCGAAAQYGRLTVDDVPARMGRLLQLRA